MNVHATNANPIERAKELAEEIYALAIRNGDDPVRLKALSLLAQLRIAEKAAQ